MSENPAERDENLDSNLDPDEIKIKWYQNKYFWVGFLGWFAANGYFYSSGAGDYGILGLVVIPLNIVVLIIVAFKNRPLAFGLLSAFAINLVVTTMQGAFYKAICFAPFFMDV